MEVGGGEGDRRSVKVGVDVQREVEVKIYDDVT